MKRYKYIAIALFGLVLTNCSGSESIFPEVILETDESTTVLPNPISLAVDDANDQFVLVNSNSGIYFKQGSLSLFDIDASDPAEPTLTQRDIIATPNFGGDVAFDGAQRFYVPFRESVDADHDQMISYDIDGNALQKQDTALIKNDPFGATVFGGKVYVVADEFMQKFNADLSSGETYDFSGLTEDGFEDAETELIRSISIDPTTGVGVIANPGGRTLIFDTATEKIRQIVAGPESVESAFIADDKLFVIDTLTEAIWVFDWIGLPTPSETPDVIDDSEFLITTIPVGNGASKMAYDATNQRLVVTNSLDDTLSLIDTTSLQEIDRIDLNPEDLPSRYKRGCDYPFDVKVADVGGESYAITTCYDSSAVAMVRLSTHAWVQIYPNTVFE